VHAATRLRMYVRKQTWPWAYSIQAPVLTARPGVVEAGVAHLSEWSARSSRDGAARRGAALVPTCAEHGAVPPAWPATHPCPPPSGGGRDPRAPHAGTRGRAVSPWRLRRSREAPDQGPPCPRSCSGSGKSQTSGTPAGSGRQTRGPLTTRAPHAMITDDALGAKPHRMMAAPTS